MRRYRPSGISVESPSPSITAVKVACAHFLSPRFRVLPVSMLCICSNKVRLQRHSSGALSVHLVVRANFACHSVISHENAHAPEQPATKTKEFHFQITPAPAFRTTHPLETVETSLSNPSTLISIKREEKVAQPPSRKCN